MQYHVYFGGVLSKLLIAQTLNAVYLALLFYVEAIPYSER